MAKEACKICSSIPFFLHQVNYCSYGKMKTFNLGPKFVARQLFMPEMIHTCHHLFVFYDSNDFFFLAVPMLSHKLLQQGNDKSSVIVTILIFIILKNIQAAAVVALARFAIFAIPSVGATPTRSLPRISINSGLGRLSLAG